MRYLLAVCDTPDPGSPFLLLSTDADLGPGPWTPTPCWNGCPYPDTHPLVEVHAPELLAWISRTIGRHVPPDTRPLTDPHQPAHDPHSGRNDTDSGGSWMSTSSPMSTPGGEG